MRPAVHRSTDGSGTLVVTVHGTPAAQGSKRYVGGGRMIDPPTVRPWRELVAMTVAERLPDGWEPLRRPVNVHLCFRFARPKAHYRANGDISPRHLFAQHIRKPDIDKLTRAILDALTTAGLWADDAQVAYLTARKEYVAAGETPGVTINVTWGPE